MQGTGKSYEVSGETTEWEDILIKKNILSREQVLLNKGLNPEDVSFDYKKSLIYVILRSSLVHREESRRGGNPNFE